MIIKVTLHERHGFSNCRTSMETWKPRITGLWGYPLIGIYPNKCLVMQKKMLCHYDDVIMGAIAYQITSLTIVYSAVYSDADQRKHQSSASLAFVWGIHRGPLNSPHKWPVTRKMFPFDDVIMPWRRHDAMPLSWGSKHDTLNKSRVLIRMM